MEGIIRIVPGFSWFGKNIGIKDGTLDFGGIFDVPCQAAASSRETRCRVLQL